MRYMTGHACDRFGLWQLSRKPQSPRHSAEVARGLWDSCGPPLWLFLSFFQAPPLQTSSLPPWQSASGKGLSWAPSSSSEELVLS